MVSILPGARGPWDLIGSATGEALERTLPGAVQQGYNRGQLQQSLDAIKNLAADPNATPMDITLAAMKAGAGIPGSERYLAQLIPILTKTAEARQSQKLGVPGEEPMQPRSHEAMEPVSRGPQLPGFAGQENQNFPTNVGPQGGPGNVPQAATTGQKQQLLTRAEKIAEAKRVANENTKLGIPTTVQEGMAIVEQAESDKKAMNDEIDKELEQRVQGQQTYGNRAAKYLKDVLPDATPEQEAIFQKIGENASKRGESEADINRYLAKQATQFKNAIVNVDKDMSAPRLLESIGRSLNGTYKDLEKSGADLRTHLKPILDLGLYDTARNMLADKGYGPEERDAIINPLSERGKVVLNKVPQLKVTNKTTPGAGPAFGLTREREPADLNNVKAGLLDLKQADPNFSLLLARKAFEDKGYNWREFKDALNDLEGKGLDLTDDQKTQRGYLDSAPLGVIDRVLHGLNLIGR